MGKLINKLCYKRYTPDNQPRWARNAIRIERPAEFNGPALLASSRACEPASLAHDGSHSQCIPQEMQTVQRRTVHEFQSDGPNIPNVRLRLVRTQEIVVARRT
jgi:hypothetical protein